MLGYIQQGYQKITSASLPPFPGLLDPQICHQSKISGFFWNATRGLLATDHVILNHGQVTWTTPELAPPSPNYHTTPTGGRFSSRQI
ncbi:hypothetical protein TNCV_4070411 [Trichonephila clavipes]|nr:hypothetical protein TNCV_4070411 [Trichonephila clavipes]